MKLIDAMARIASWTFLSRIAGFVRDILTAVYLGAGPVADAFFVALKLPNLFRRITAEGAFSAAFVPIYTETLEREGKRAAGRFAGSTLAWMLIILSLATAAMVWGMPWIIGIIAPGFADEPERLNTAIVLGRITFVYIVLISAVALLGGILNAHSRFSPFAAAPVLFNLSLIGALLFLSAHMPSSGHAMAAGVVIAGVVQLVMLGFFARRYRVAILPGPVRPDGKMRRLLRLMGPGVVGAGVMHINMLADMIIASMLSTGAISYLYYADRLNQLPLGVVGIAIGTALLPMLSRALSNDDQGQAQNLYNRALEVCLLLGLPAAAALLAMPEIIITTLFEHGVFAAGDSAATARVLSGYAVGIPAYVGVKVLTSASWARQDTATPVRVMTWGTLANVILSICFVLVIGVAGIALATGLTGWLQFWLLRRRMAGHGFARADARLNHVWPRALVASAVMAAGLFVARYLMPGFGGAGLAFQIAVLSLLVIGGALVYCVILLASGAIHMQDIRHYLKRDHETAERTR